MKSILVTLIISCSFISNAFAEDSCTADTSKYTEQGLKNRKPIFDAKSKKVEKTLPSKLIQYGFSDSVKLKNGMEVTYTVGGCAHYGYNFVFKGKEVKAVKSSEKLARAELLLKSLDLNDNSERNLFLNALLEAKKKKPTELSDGVFELPCGDATCMLTDRGDQEVTISYSFAL